MASKRHLRRKECQAKVRHDTVDHANFHARNLTRFRQIAYHSYHCQFCGGWHVGNVDKPLLAMRKR